MSRREPSENVENQSWMKAIGACITWGCSLHQAADYVAVRVEGRSVEDWADTRASSAQAVKQNVERAESILPGPLPGADPHQLVDDDSPSARDDGAAQLTFADGGDDGR